jgi:hypothetical protein
MALTYRHRTRQELNPRRPASTYQPNLATMIASSVEESGKTANIKGSNHRYHTDG